MLRKYVVLLMLLLGSSLVHAEWNEASKEAWGSRAKITINAAGITAAEPEVPVVLRLHSGNFDFSSANLDGSDLRVVAGDDKTELKFHIEKFDSINELAVIWVLLPKLDPAAKDAHIWLYSGNETATSTADAAGSFDAATAAVFHFAESTLLQDSKRGLTASGNVTVQKAALIGEAAVLNGEPLVLAANPALALNDAQGFSFTAWLKPGAAEGTLYQQGAVTISLAAGKLQFNNGSAVVAGGELKPAAWQHVAVTVAGGKAVLYIDGAEVANGAAALPALQDAVQVGNGYQGELDELVLASAARSAAWIKAAASGQSMDGQLIKVSAAEGEDEEEGGSSHFMVLFHSLTVDAWVVIIILAVMFAISAAVMVAKARQVARNDKANRIFINRFNDAGHAELLQLDQGADIQNSTVVRLYLAGLREIRKRYDEAGHWR
ncbi:DUF2341 domain-containing protein [Methylobacillus glycogenes]|uniref:DUF2341 domain-containing protein n=1 Tax=Methylobacillus glycogenes TaxID=406 RepID=UPI000AE1F640|nr:DUF2341 domain-containing protein [Methylobacillus glycogenes]